MELNDAIRRIVGQHWEIIVALVVAGALVAALAHWQDVPRYTASVRTVLDTQDPKTQSESAVIADTARAITTSPSQVGQALERANVTGRDPVRLAKHDVHVRALGASGVLEISVTDPNPRAAARVANALAAILIQARLGVTTGQVQQSLATLDARIDELSRKIARANRQADALVVRGAATRVPELVNALRNQHDQVIRSRDFLVQQRAVRESEQVNLLSTLALRPKPSVISPAATPVLADASAELPDMVLGALIGLLLGIGLAGLHETMRPTLVGGEALARELDAPLLGSITLGPDRDLTRSESLGIAERLWMAVDGAHVRSVTLVPTERKADVHARCLARLLQQVRDDGHPRRRDGAAAAVGGTTPAFQVQHAPGDGPEVPSFSRIPVSTLGVDSPSVSNGGATGLVVVAPATVKKQELDDTSHLLRVSPAPLLGLIAYTAPRPAWRHRSPNRRKQP